MSGVYKRGGPSRSCPEPHSSRLSHRAAPVEWGEGSSGHRVPPPRAPTSAGSGSRVLWGSPFSRGAVVSPHSSQFWSMRGACRAVLWGCWLDPFPFLLKRGWSHPRLDPQQGQEETEWVCVCGHRAVRGGCWPGSKLGLPVRVAWVGGWEALPHWLRSCPPPSSPISPSPRATQPCAHSCAPPPPCLKPQPHNLCFIFTVWGEGSVFRDPVL